MSIVNGCGHGGKVDGNGVPLGWRQRHGGKDIPSESKSSRGDDEEKDEDGEEGEVTPPPHSLLPEDLPSFGDIFSRQAGISVSVG
jgi:hypothetical protein